MSKKNKIKKHKSHQPHANAQLKRIGTVKKEVRKGPSILTLAIMGGAVIFGIRSCSKESPTSTVTIFKDSDDCVLAGYSRSFCTQKQEEAQQQLIQHMAYYNQLNSCESIYGQGNCTLINRKLTLYENLECLSQNHDNEYCDAQEREAYAPTLAGFSVDNYPSEVSRSSTSAHSGLHYYSRARPFYRSKSEPDVYYEPGSSDKWVSDGSNKLKSAKYSNNSTKTTSRGGFGHKSSRKGG
ncbi:DUF1190 domain-containing protein [Providencia vermicola]|uniref:DUF1190 domain-containing protein n=1 Tax=Providencia TaxID=586 RepID=UPI0012B51B69|nr:MULTISPECIES: DUF1190 domain-containing protein [unclassified Providencia]MTB38869.1 DUF1190 domain-containing protein [Providencia sp. wls1949]MTC07695.1 DUF1190 domain-containing protein [Providencia sp. wls1948]